VILAHGGEDMLKDLYSDYMNSGKVGEISDFDLTLAIDTSKLPKTHSISDKSFFRNQKIFK
jgi:hypothetical protein